MSEHETWGPALVFETSIEAPAAPSARLRSVARTVIPSLASLALAAGGYLTHRFPVKPPVPPKLVRSPGIEGDDSAVGPKVTGRILEIRVRGGDSVKASDVIAMLDDPQGPWKRQ